MTSVSVLMAVHNGERFLAETLQSVFAQTLDDFEFLIVDDASSDSTPSILAQAAASDSRVRLIRNTENIGLTSSLNVGLLQASGTYIARIDADDICLPERLREQFLFLEERPDHIAVACGHETINERGHTVSTSPDGLDDWQVRWLGGFNPPAPHPTYFFRRLQSDGTQNLYDEAFRTAQDFDLWSRMSLQGKTAVMPGALIKYRRHAEAITVQKRQEQAANCRRTGLANLGRRLPPEILRQLHALIDLFSYQAPADRETIAAAVAGGDAMLAHDLAIAPSEFHKRWIRRMTAGLIADAILSRASGFRSVSATAGFLFYARKHLLQLLLAIANDPHRAIKALRNVGRY